MNDLKKIVCISAIRWDDMNQRIQHLMMQLSKDFEVLYVNPAFDYSKALKYKKQKGYFGSNGSFIDRCIVCRDNSGSGGDNIGRE